MNTGTRKEASAEITSQRCIGPTVFFDGGCPLCRREIAHYQRLDRRGRIRWVDIQREQAYLRQVGLSRQSAMERFHVLDKGQRWQTGAWGFVEMWAYLPYYYWVARLLQSLRLVGLLERAYVPFARWRLAKRCVDDRCPSGVDS